MKTTTSCALRLFTLAMLASLLTGVASMATAADVKPLFFDLDDTGEPDPSVPVVQPWKVVQLDPDYGGQWIVAGDVDGDGQVEIVSAENYNEGDVHYTSAVVAQKPDGTVLWQWGDPAVGRKKWHHDVACQIHDWDGDGKKEVVVCAKDAIVELDGATGQERRRIPIQEEATDCLVFCDLSGKGRPTDVLVKDRYHRIWAYSQAGELLWNVQDPGGHMTAHQPRPMDVDGDGRDEIMAGFALLNPDESVRWTFKSNVYEKQGGHLDCARVFRAADNPEDFRIAITCCGGNNVALLDGNGKPVWEVTGHHFESADVGKVFPDVPGPQIVVDIDHMPFGNGPVWILSEDGKLLGRIVTDYSRHHCLLDWDGDGADEILVANSQGIYSHTGKRVATLAMPGDARTGERGYETSLVPADMTGNGIPDVLLVTPEAVHIFRNEQGRKPTPPYPLGSEPNFTLY